MSSLENEFVKLSLAIAILVGLILGGHLQEAWEGKLDLSYTDKSYIARKGVEHARYYEAYVSCGLRSNYLSFSCHGKS